MGDTFDTTFLGDLFKTELNFMADCLEDELDPNFASFTKEDFFLILSILNGDFFAAEIVANVFTGNFFDNKSVASVLACGFLCGDSKVFLDEVFTGAISVDMVFTGDISGEYAFTGDISVASVFTGGISGDSVLTGDISGDSVLTGDISLAKFCTGDIIDNFVTSFSAFTGDFCGDAFEMSPSRGLSEELIGVERSSIPADGDILGNDPCVDKQGFLMGVSFGAVLVVDDDKHRLVPTFPLAVERDALIKDSDSNASVIFFDNARLRLPPSTLYDFTSLTLCKTSGVVKLSGIS